MLTFYLVHAPPTYLINHKYIINSYHSNYTCYLTPNINSYGYIFESYKILLSKPGPLYK